MTTIASPAVQPRVRRTITLPPWPERIVWGLAALASVAGLAGVIWRFTGGHQAADYGSYVPWGLWIAAYVALVGASAGAFAFAAFIFGNRRRQHYPLAELALLVAFGAFIAGMANVWLDLGHPFRAWRLLVDTSTSSVMGLMAWFYAVYGIVLAVGLWETRRGNVPRFMERFAWLAFLFAVVFAGAEGALFGVVGAQPTWESGLTPVVFLLEGALFGLSLVAAAGALFKLITSETTRRLGQVLVALLLALVVVEAFEYFTGLQAAVPAKEHAFEAILTGRYWWVFWVLHLGLGIVVPAAILLRARGRAAWLGAAGGLVASMALASKLNLVVPALAAHEDIEGLSGAFTGPGLVHEYVPSAMEWLVTVGTVGVAALVVLAGHHLLHHTGTAGDQVSAPPRGSTRRV